MQVNSNNLWLNVKEKHISGLVAFNKSNNQRFCCWKLVKCKRKKKKKRFVSQVILVLLEIGGTLVYVETLECKEKMECQDHLDSQV